jgi:NADH-quinone oxidoreductase subunit J
MDPVGRYVYFLFALTAIASALLFVTRRSPVAAALWLVSTMFSIAGIYVLLDAQFVAAVQVLVYAGAIMVVFLFVVMLLNLGESDAAAEFRKNRTRIAAGAIGLALLAVPLASYRGGGFGRALLPGVVAGSTSPVTGEANVVAPVAHAIFTDYLIAFEVTSLLLLASVVGAVALAKRRTAA